SKVYDHYLKPEVVHVQPGNIIMHRFICKCYPSKHVDRADYEDSTGNLKHHVHLCQPDDVPKAESIVAFAGGATYSPAHLHFLLAMWCACRHHPFTIVDNPEFLSILRMLYGKVEVPSRVTVSRDIQLILDETLAKLIQQFESLDGKVHLCVDGWTSPNIISFLGMTAHWHEAGEIRYVILEFIRYVRSA
ncbi:hypothetical protein C8Q80DRAFT_1101255, partial [Daedaleopsis nitida]